MGIIAVIAAVAWISVMLVVFAMCRAAARADANSEILIASHNDPLSVLAARPMSGGGPGRLLVAAAEYERPERREPAAEDDVRHAGADRQLVLVAH